MNKKSHYMETILYLKGLIVLLESLDKPDTEEDKQKLSIGVLRDMQKNIGSLIEKVEKITM